MIIRRSLLLVLFLAVVNTVFFQDGEEEVELSCNFDPDNEQFEGIDPTQQNTIDRMIQRIQGTAFGSFIRRTIRRNLLNPDSKIRQMLGKLAQDPHSEDFEEGDVGIDKPVYGPVLSLLSKVVGETKTVVGYLRAFGFFSKVLGMSPNKLDNYQGGIPACAITQAVKEFQVFNNLEPTGTLTKETRDLMRKDRCGNPDVQCDTPACEAERAAEAETQYLERKKRALNRQKRYVVTTGRKWYFGDFKYYYQGYSTDLPEDVQREDIAKALKLWSDVANINFEETDVEEDSDIRIDFGGGDHGDRYPFDGPLGVLAHGYYPTKGDIHFDDEENFTSNTYDGTNLLFVATHEMGHVLGIKHSTISGAVMQAYYPGYKANLKLHQDDINAAIELFGQKPAAEEPTDECSGVEKVDAGWSEYTDWSACDQGIQFRSRVCNNPPKSKCGADCSGSGVETRTCSDTPEPGKCSFGDYGDWSTCTTECDGGTQYRSRQCTDDKTGDSCNDCDGGYTESRECNTQACPEEEEEEEEDESRGQIKELKLIPYSEVKQSSTFKGREASLAVDDNLETRSSTKCTGNSAAFFRYKFAEEYKVGRVEIVNGNYDKKRNKLDNAVVYVETADRQKIECGRVEVTDVLSTKGQTYTIDCGGRLAKSVRISQETKWNGRKCLDLKEVKVYGLSSGGIDDLTHGDEATESEVDDGWSEYSEWSECSVDCGRGSRTRTRTCTKSDPQGEECLGPDEEWDRCLITDCSTPVDGGWSDYTDWTECTRECGGGTQSRTRTCTNPAPADGGEDCQGEGTESRECNTQQCTGLESYLLLRHSEVSQSSTSDSDTAELAVDNNIDTMSRTTVTSKNNAWYRYTLSGLQRVGKVKIVNGNLNKKRMKLDNAVVYAESESGKSECGKIKVKNTETTEGQTYIIDCEGQLATSIKIVQTNKWQKRKSMDLSEVQVYRVPEA